MGEQLWMAENLRVTHYNDGSKIPTGYSGAEWTELETREHAVYPADDDNASNLGESEDGQELIIQIAVIVHRQTLG